MINFTRNRSTVEIARQAKLQTDIERLQTSVSTGKRFQTASDDPVGNARVSQIRRTQGNEAAFNSNAETASTLATRVDSAFGSITTVLDRARELTVLAANGTYSADQRKAVAVELRELSATVKSISEQKDPRGIDLFPAGKVVSFAIGDGITASGTVTRDAAFGGIPASGGGTKSLSAILEDAAAAAESGTAADRSTALTDVGAASDHVIQQHSLHGLEAARIDQSIERLATSNVELTDERSGIETTDVAEATTLIKANLTNLEAAQAIFARVNQKTLFDVLR